MSAECYLLWDETCRKFLLTDSVFTEQVEKVRISE